MNYEIRQCSNQDVFSVKDFVVSLPEDEVSTNVQIGEDEQMTWGWLFLRGSIHSRIAVAAFSDNNQVIGHYGISPINYVTPEGKIELGIICKLAIAHAYRHSLLFLQISLKLFNLAKENKIENYAGLANRKGMTEFHKAMGFVNKGGIPVLFAPVSLLGLGNDLLPRALFLILAPVLMVLNSVLRIFLRLFLLKMGNSIKVVEISTPNIKLELNDILACSHQYYADRSTSNLFWRFEQNSCRKYVIFGAYDSGLKGYVVLRKMKMRQLNGVAIVDIVVDTNNPLILKSLIKCCYEFAIEQKASCLAVLLSDRDIAEDMLKLGFFRTKESFDLVIRCVNKESPILSSSLEEWYLTWFDHDTA